MDLDAGVPEDHGGEVQPQLLVNFEGVYIALLRVDCPDILQSCGMGKPLRGWNSATISSKTRLH